MNRILVDTISKINRMTMIANRYRMTMCGYGNSVRVGRDSYRMRVGRYRHCVRVIRNTYIMIVARVGHIVAMAAGR